MEEHQPSEEQKGVNGTESKDDVPSEVTFECGATLSIKRPSAMLVSTLMTQVEKDNPPPKVPTAYVEDKGRDYPNPDDPTYRTAMNVWNSQTGLRLYRTLLVATLGVKELGEAYDPNGEEFADFVEALGFEVATGKSSRFLQWLMTYAMTEDESAQMAQWLLILGGLREDDIAEAITFLEGDPAGQTDRVGSA